MKRIIPYIITLFIGFFIGWLYMRTYTINEPEKSIKIFEDKSEENQPANDKVWTCSMHPQIRQHHSGKCPICGMNLIPSNQFSDGEERLQNNQVKLSKNALALANIQTSKVINLESEPENVISLSGKIQENESSFFIQAAHINGRLERFSVTYEGQYVKKGQYIGSVYSPEIVNAERELLLAMEDKKKQPEIYNAVREKLKLWKLSDKTISQIEQRKKIINNFPLYADKSGVVKKLMATVGNYLNKGTPMYSLSDLSKVWATLDAYEQDIHRFKIGQHVQIETSAYPGMVFKGKISFIEPTLNSQTHTIAIRVEIQNEKMKLKPGMLAFANIILSKNQLKNKELVVPKSAVLWTGKRSVVYVKTDHKKSIFQMREVTLGNALKDDYIVIKGLKRNEEVVTNGAFTIDAAAQLVGKNSLMNPLKEQTQKGSVFSTNDLFKKQLTHFYTAYLKIKDFMVKDKNTESIKSAKAAIGILEKVNANTLKNEKSKKQWLRLKQELKKSLIQISAVENPEQGKTYFKILSKNLATAVSAFGVGDKVYQMYCPMANATWLSNQKKILNPYFGSKMLTCGTLNREIIHKIHKNMH